MKRLILILFSIILITFLIPIIFTCKFNTSQVTAEITENTKNSNETIDTQDNESGNYEYSKYSTIKLLHTQTNTVEELALDEYILGVVSAEMPATFEQEALNAQAVVARTYTIYVAENSGKHENADICDDSTCCQAWISKENRLARWDENQREENWAKIEYAVYSTQGKIITYNNAVIDAFFHSNSGGKTEVVSNVWGGADLPYLQSVETAGEDLYSQYSSETVLTKSEFEQKVKNEHPDFFIDYNSEDCIKILEYTQGDRVKTIKLGNLELSGVEVRTLLGLKSANFTVQISEENIKFTVIRLWAWSWNESNWCRRIS